MKDFRSCFKALISSLRPVAGRVAFSCAVGIIRVALSLAFVWASKRVVDIATSRLDLPLERNVIVMAGIMLAQVLFSVLATYWDSFVNLKSVNEKRALDFGKVMNSAWDGQDKYHSGDTINRLEDDIREVTSFLCTNLPSLITTVVQLLAASAYLFILSPSLAWVLLIVMPVAVVGSRLFFRKMRALTGEIRRSDSLIQQHMQENIQQRSVVKTLGGLRGALEKMGFLQDIREERTMKRMKYSALSRGFMQLGFASGYALAFFWGVFGLRDGSVSYGMMVAFLQLVGQVQRPISDIAMQIPAFIRALASEERLLDLEQMEQEPSEPDVRFDGAPGLRLEGLSFRYSGRELPVLDNLSFDFKPGSVTAILGETGVGKSTLIKLMMALLKPDSGSVIMYSPSPGAAPSSPVSEVASSSSTRCNYMYVPQGNTLLSGTIAENLRMACPEAGEEMMMDALHTAAADFVAELPLGLETPCSEIGRGLSEGQAQRIAIARALLRPGGILILDEATSSLDAETELELLKRLSLKYKGRKTIICITHRPAATSYADSVLDLGRVSS